MKVAIARFYTNNLSEEVRKGQKEKIAQGWWPTKPPIGYKTIGEKGHKTQVLDEAKSLFVRRMFDLYSSGNYSVIALSDLMYREGLRGRTGKKIGKSCIYTMLRDPFYYGVLRWKGRDSPGKHEPLISREIYGRVQTLLNRSLNKPQFNKHLPVFKAKMICIRCGGSVTWETHKGHWYGHCNGYMRPGMTKKCDGKSCFIRQDRIEEAMFPFFDKVMPMNSRVLDILRESLRESHIDEIDRFDRKLSELNQTIARAQRRLEACYEDKLDGKISAETYQNLAKRYTDEKDAATAQITSLNRGNEAYYQAGFAIHELAEHASKIYQSEHTTNEDRRLLLSYVFSNIEINGKEAKFVYSKTFEFLVYWIPKLNAILELEDMLTNAGEKDKFGPSHPVVRAHQDSNLGRRFWRPLFYH
jgi:site-specific DNA recombinase